MRIRRLWLKALFAIGTAFAWLTLLGIVGAFGGANGEDVAHFLIQFPAAAAGVLICLRVFRGNEGSDPGRRPWWQATGGPIVGYVAATFFAVVAVLGIGGLQGLLTHHYSLAAYASEVASPRAYRFAVAEDLIQATLGALLAWYFYRSSRRLQRTPAVDPRGASLAGTESHESALEPIAAPARIATEDDGTVLASLRVVITRRLIAQHVLAVYLFTLRGDKIRVRVLFGVPVASFVCSLIAFGLDRGPMRWAWLVVTALTLAMLILIFAQSYRKGREALEPGKSIQSRVRLSRISLRYRQGVTTYRYTDYADCQVIAGIVVMSHLETKALVLIPEKLFPRPVRDAVLAELGGSRPGSPSPAS